MQQEIGSIQTTAPLIDFSTRSVAISKYKELQFSGQGKTPEDRTRYLRPYFDYIGSVSCLEGPKTRESMEILLYFSRSNDEILRSLAIESLYQAACYDKDEAFEAMIANVYDQEGKFSNIALQSLGKVAVSNTKGSIRAISNIGNILDCAENGQQFNIALTSLTDSLNKNNEEAYNIVLGIVNNINHPYRNLAIDLLARVVYFNAMGSNIAANKLCSIIDDRNDPGSSEAIQSSVSVVPWNNNKQIFNSLENILNYDYDIDRVMLVYKVLAQTISKAYDRDPGYIALEMIKKYLLCYSSVRQMFKPNILASNMAEKEKVLIEYLNGNDLSMLIRILQKNKVVVSKDQIQEKQPKKHSFPNILHAI